MHENLHYQKHSKYRKVPLRFFSALWDKNFSTKKRGNPRLNHTFFHTRTILKHKAHPYENFWYSETKVRQKCDAPLSNAWKFSSSGFFRNRRVPLRSFLALWDKKFSRKNAVNILNFLSFIITFIHSFFQKHLSETKGSTLQKTLYKTVMSPPRMQAKFHYQNFFEEKDPLGRFRPREKGDKKVSKEKRDTTPTLSYPYLFRTRTILEPKGPTTKIFGTVRQNRYRQNSGAPLPMHEKFKYENFFETQKGSSKTLRFFRAL